MRLLESGLKASCSLASRPAMLLSLTIIALCIGFCGPELKPIPGIKADRPVKVRGRVVSIPEKTDYGWLVRVSPIEVLQSGKLLDYSGTIPLRFNTGIKGECPTSLFRGSAVEFRGVLKRPSYNLIPGVKDRRILAEARDIPFSIDLKSSLQIETGKSEGGPANNLYRYLLGFVSCLDSEAPEKTASLARALLLGQKRAIPNDLYQKMNRLGVTHFFVISGFHIGIIAFSLYLVFGRFGRTAVLFVAPPLIWFYIWMIGFPTPAVRAGIITTLGVLLLETGLQKKLLNLLGLAAIIIVLENPAVPYLPGFQMTFLAIAGIILLASPLHDYLGIPEESLRCFRQKEVYPEAGGRAGILRKVRTCFEDYCRHFPEQILKPAGRCLPFLVRPLKIIVCTACIQFFLAPLLVFHFNCLNLYSPISTLILFLPLTMLIILGMAMLIAWWTPVAPALLDIYSLIVNITSGLICWLDINFPPLYLFHPHPGVILCFYLVLLAGIYLNPAMGWIPSLILLVSYFSWIPCFPASPDNRLEISMLDVGQGECLHLRYPNGRNGLIDAGGTSYAGNQHYVGKSLIGRYLWDRRIEELSYILVTHPEQDHCGGFSFIKQVFKQHRFYCHDPPPDCPPSAEILSAGDSFAVGGVFHEVLWPAKDLKGFDNLNDRSLVILVTFGEFRALFTGDISARVEEELTKRGSPAGLSVLKVSHHGSKYSSSSEFLSSLDPVCAIISAGRRNPFGHPAGEVLDRMKESGIKVYSTPEHGTIRIVTDGKHTRVIATRDSD